jgi:hypothetical protein
MNEDKASAPLRLSIRATIGATPADPNSLRNIITNIYPDGALCFVLENRALYQLDKGSTATADNVTVIQPIGGPGRWFQMSQVLGADTFVEIVGTAENTADTSGTANFVAIAGAAFGFQPTGVPPGWTLTAAGGVLHYAGEFAARALVTLESSVYIGVSGGPVWAAVAHNGDVLGTDAATSFLPGTQVTETGSDDEAQALSSQRTLVLTPGDTLQIALATTAGADVTLTRGTLSVLLG